MAKFSSITLGLLVFATLSPIYIKFSGVEAVSGTANPSTTTLSLNVVDNLLSLDLSPTSSYGTFASSSPASIQVSTNNVSGYTLSIKSNVVDTSDSNAVSNATNLVNTVDSTKVISSISTATSSSAFSTNTNTQYNNKWGYLPSKLNSLANTNYLPSPSYNEATILNTTTCANGITSASCTTSATDTYTITLGARVDSTLPTGSYEHDFVLIAVGNPINYSITYHANDGADGAGTTNMPTPNPQTGNADSNTTSVVLSTNKPRRQGYELKGWCSVVPTADSTYPDDQNCTGEGAVLYQPGAAYGIDQTTINIVDLYATWWQPNLTKLNESHATMQQMSPMACYNSAIGDTATLTDNRDGTTKSYTVAKLADNNCWMTTNLNLGTDHDITLTADDTDLAANTTFTLPAADTTSYTSSTNLAKVRLTNNGGTNANGAYYTWSAAVANTTSISTSPTTSICPKNWDLPANAQYTNLSSKSAYSSSNPTTAAPSSFLTNGGFTQGSSFYQTSYSYFWTNTSTSTTVAYGARVNGTTMTTNNSTGNTYGGNKYYRKNIRCIASNGTATINYDGNGTTEYPVTGTTTSQVDVEINSTMTRANGFTRTGWYFNGWNTKADGSGIAIAAGSASTTPLSNLGLADGDTITLYAQWLPQFIITYVNNCKAWATSDTNCTDTSSAGTSTQAINLDASGNGSSTLGNYNKFTMTGWKIKDWTETATGEGEAYPVNSTYQVTNAVAGDGITLYAHWVPIYTVQYDGNGADNASTGMGVANATTGIKGVRHYNVAEGDTFDLFASNFKRTGYGFVGWSTDSDAWNKLTDNDNTNDAKIWGPNEIITAPAPNGTPITTLYAIWAPAEKDGSNNPVYLQDWEGCSSMTATTYNTTTGKLIVTKNTITALTDKRDNMVYTVAKLADGNCWMVENLRLDNGATVGNNINDSSVTNQSLAQGYGGVFTGLPTTESTNFSNSTTPNSLYTTDTTSTTLNIITGGSNFGYRFPRYNNTNITWNNNSSSATTPTSPSQNITSANAHTDYNNYVYSYGNYYTWASAIADTSEYNSLSAHPKSDTSICPTGWHLPNGSNGTNSTSNMGGLSGGFSYLDKQMGGSGNNSSINSTTNATNSRAWRMFPNNFIYSGNWDGSSASLRGGSGGYWSSSAGSSYGAYSLYFSSSYVYPGTVNDTKLNGFAVRCVAGGSGS